jgi:FkbM family methyltransferase
MTPTRFKVVRQFLKKTNNVSLSELCSYFFAPSYRNLASRFIRKIDEDGQHFLIYLQNFETPLYYPKDLNPHSLRQVIVECFNPRNWHYYEIPETRVSPKDIVVDCGAAEGLFAFVIRERCKKVYLIEPLARFIECLELTFQQATNIEIVPFAISDHEFSTKIISNDISSALSDEGEGERVAVSTLDKLFFDRGIPVSYLKLDLEGYDYKALVGGKQLIQKNKPKIAITTYHDKDHASQMEKFLKSVVPEYNILCKGIYQDTGSPVMLHAWI